jgi:predicted GH43/DUF377 family glycosyl hydrolase
MSTNYNNERNKKIQEALNRRKATHTSVTDLPNGRQIILHADGTKVIVQKGKRQKAELARIPPSFKKTSDARPASNFLMRLGGTIQRLPLPAGSFNGSILKLDDKYLFVYRPNEFVFDAVFLNSKFEIIPDTLKRLDLNGDVADPRLIITPANKVMVSYSRFNMAHQIEFICGSYIMDLNVNQEINESEHFRISPENLVDRQKNWMPFVSDGKIYFISDIKPHRIYEFNETTKECHMAHEVHYQHAWFNKFQLRGNTNCVKIDDDYFLTIFHSVQKIDNCCYYDNGAYLFDAKPPFRPSFFCNRTIMPAEFALEKHYRKDGEILCVFPMSLHKEDDDELVITYGDNDSAVRILKTSFSEIKGFMIKV